MSVANKYILHQIVGGLNTIADDEVSDVVDYNDAKSNRVIVRKFIRPRILALNDESIALCKDSLAYFLRTNETSFDDILGAQQDSPLEPPDNPRDFFVWIWEELFPDEDYSFDHRLDWTVNNDIRTRLRRRI